MLGSCRRHPKPNVLSAAAPGRAAGSNHRVSWKKLPREGSGEGSGGLHVASKALGDELDGSLGPRPARPPQAAPLPAASSSSAPRREGADSGVCSPAASSALAFDALPKRGGLGHPPPCRAGAGSAPRCPAWPRAARGAEAVRGAQAAAGGQGAALRGRFDAGGPGCAQWEPALPAGWGCSEARVIDGLVFLLQSLSQAVRIYGRGPPRAGGGWWRLPGLQAGASGG